MRTFILVAGFVLTSATAQAGERGLSLAATDTPVVTAPAKSGGTQKTAEAPQAAESPKYVERPAVVEPEAEMPKGEPSNTEPAKPVVQKTASAPKAERPHRRHYWTEARIIGELHRHGVYW
jgi:hypothetical protein